MHDEANVKLAMDEVAQLRTLVGLRNPSLQPVVEGLGKIDLTTKEREGLRAVLLEEMIERGLDQEDEPNRYGALLDSMIGRLSGY